MLRATDIMPITGFTRSYQQVVRALKKHGRPTVLTIDGKPSVVVQDAAAYQKSLELLDAMYIDMMVDRAMADKRPSMTVDQLRARLGTLKSSRAAGTGKGTRRAA